MRSRPRRLLLPAVLASVFSLLVGVAAPAVADDASDRKRKIDAQVKSLQGDLDETSKALQDAAAKLQSAQGTLTAAQAAVRTASARVDTAKARVATVNTRLAVAVAEESASQRRLATVRGEMAETRAQIGRLARAAYQNGQVSQLAVALEADSPSDFTERVVLLQSASRSRNGAFATLAEAKAEVAAEQERLAAKRDAVEALKRKAQAQMEAVTALETKARSAQSQVEQLVRDAADAKAVIAREKASQLQQMAAAKAESQRLNKILAARAAAARRAAAAASNGGGGGGGSSFTGGSGTLARPVNAPITSSYGMRVHPVTGIYKLHDGTDFGVSCGTPVHAAADGTVVWSRLMSGYGNQLAIDHGTVRGHQITTSYSHLQSFAVGAGTQVTRGQLIGYSGGAAGMYGAGSSTGCHLHFMVMDQAAPINVNGFPTVDPMNWL